MCKSGFLYLYTFYTPRTAYGVRRTAYGVRRTAYGVRRTAYGVQCTVYSVQCTVYSVQCTVYSVQCTVALLSRITDPLPTVLDHVIDEVHSGQLPVHAQPLQVLVPHTHHHLHVRPAKFTAMI